MAVPQSEISHAELRNRKESVGTIELQGPGGQVRTVNVDDLNEADKALAAEFGYKPVFKREFGYLSAFSFAVSISGLFSTVATTFSYPVRLIRRGLRRMLKRCVAICGRKRICCLVLVDIWSWLHVHCCTSSIRFELTRIRQNCSNMCHSALSLNLCRHILHAEDCTIPSRDLRLRNGYHLLAGLWAG